MDAGFLHVVDIGKYFMKKDIQNSHNLQIQRSREYTLPSEEASQPKESIQGKIKFWPVLVACMESTELRSEFRLCTAIITTPRSEFLMDQINV